MARVVRGHMKNRKGYFRFAFVAFGCCMVMLSLASMFVRIYPFPSFVAMEQETNGSGYGRRLVRDNTAFDGKGMGIGDEVEFAVQELHRQWCINSIQEKLRVEFAPYFRKYPGGVALIDVALHRNLGDNLLWWGALALLSDFGISPGIVCYISQPAWDDEVTSKAESCNYSSIIRVVRHKGLVLFHGGGNWGDLYGFVQEQRMQWLQDLNADARMHGFGIIQLPQTIYYENASSLATDAAVLKQIDPDVFTLFVRSKPSYEIAKANFGRIPVRLTPDIAFAMGAMASNHRPTYDVLILRRQDVESYPLDDGIWEWLDVQFHGANLTFRVQDWWYIPDDHPREATAYGFPLFGKIRTSAANEILSQGRVVITNRLHGSIVATLTGKHVFVVDTKQAKLESVLENAFSQSAYCTPENLHMHSRANLTDAVESAIELLLLKGKGFLYN